MDEIKEAKDKEIISSKLEEVKKKFKEKKKLTTEDLIVLSASNSDMFKE